MSARFCILPARIVGDKNLKMTDVQVMHSLGLFADKSGWCWPSCQQIASKAGLSTRTVQRSLLKLKSLNYIESVARYEDGRQLSNKIRVIYDTSVVDHEELPRVSSESPPPDSQGVMPPLTAKVSPQYINDPIERPNKPYIPLQDDLPEWLNMESWRGFEDMRRTVLRKPITARARGMLIKKLDRFKALGHDPNDILETSTINCWLGVYCPKEKKRPPPEPGSRRAMLEAFPGYIPSHWEDWSDEKH